MTDSSKIIIHADPDLKELIPEFLKHREEDLQLIAQALKDGDFKTLQRIGHQMKGAGSGYGFDGITQIGADLEACAKQAKAEGIRKALDELNDYLQRLVIVDE